MMPKRKSQAKKASKPPKARGAYGQVGPQTYDAVLRVAKEKNVTLAKAFEEVAKATDRKPGTVANTYFRIARKKRGGVRGKKQSASTAATRAPANSAKAILTRVATAM